MKRLLSLSALLLLAVVLSFCQKAKGVSGAQTNAIKQGVCGTVIWKEGNLMPGPGRTVPQGTGVERDVVAYELTKSDQVTSEGGFHRNITTKLVKKVTSDAKGNFCMELPEGEYSLFVWEDGKGLYANSFDGQGNIFPITVQKGKVEQTNITVDYMAAY